LVVGLLLAIPTFESVNGVDDINFSDEEILITLLEVQEKVLMMIKRSINLTEQATFINHKSRPISKPEQQQARIVAMNTIKLADAHDLSSWEIFQVSIHNCLSCVHNCGDQSYLHIMIILRSSNI